MANWARGFAAGLEPGYRMGEMYQRGAERRALQEAAQAQPTELQGYTAEQGAQLEAAAKSGLYDIGLKTDESGNFQGYTVTPKASPEMQGLVAPDQVTEMYGQRYAGALTPERVQGLRMGRMADVVAETDPIRAQQLRAQQAEQEYQSKLRPMQLESAGLRLTGERADAADRERMSQFQAWGQQNPELLKDFNAVRSKLVELGAPTKMQFEVASQLTGIDKAEFEASQARIRKLVQGQGLDGLLKLHRESADLDPGSHFEPVRGKDGTVTLNRVDTATGRVIQPNVFSGKEDQVVGYLNKAAMDPGTIVDYTMNVRKTEAAIRASEAQTEASRATVGLTNLRANALSTDAATRGKLLDLEARYAELTPAEQMGEKGRGLIQQYNMLAAGPGKTVSLGAAPRAERPALSESDITSRAKAMIEANERNPDTGKKYTFNEAVKFIRAGEVSNFDRDAQALDKALGGGGDPFAPSAPAARTQAAAPAANPRIGTGERNPYVDASGRPLPNAPAGAPALITQVPGAVAGAVQRGLSAGESNYAAYLQSKIANRQPLTADEAIRARRFGLTQ